MIIKQHLEENKQTTKRHIIFLYLINLSGTPNSFHARKTSPAPNSTLPRPEFTPRTLITPGASVTWRAHLHPSEFSAPVAGRADVATPPPDQLPGAPENAIDPCRAVQEVGSDDGQRSRGGGSERGGCVTREINILRVMRIDKVHGAIKRVAFGAEGER